MLDNALVLEKLKKFLIHFMLQCTEEDVKTQIPLNLKKTEEIVRNSTLIANATLEHFLALPRTLRESKLEIVAKLKETEEAEISKNSDQDELHVLEEKGKKINETILVLRQSLKRISKFFLIFLSVQ